MTHLFSDLRSLARRDVLRRLWRSIQEDDLSGLAAEVSYYALLGLFPFLMFVASVLTLVVNDPAVSLREMLAVLHWLLPTTTAALLTQFLTGPVHANRPLLLSIGIVGVVWAGSNGFASVLKALNRIYCPTRTRSWLRHRTLSLDVMARVTFASLAALVVMTGTGPAWLIPAWLRLPERMFAVWGWLRWPLLFILLSLVSTWFYATVPCARLRGRWSTTGGIIASLAWLGAGAGFSTFMNLTNTYANVYGAASSMIMLLVWIYLGVYLVLIGAEINAELIDIAKPATARVPAAAAHDPSDAPDHPAPARAHTHARRGRR